MLDNYKTIKKISKILEEDGVDCNEEFLQELKESEERRKSIEEKEKQLRKWMEDTSKLFNTRLISYEFGSNGKTNIIIENINMIQ